MASKIIVLGGSGYIGSNLVAALKNAEIIEVARKKSGERSHAYSEDLSQKLLPSDHPLFKERPEQVYYLGRPVELNFQAYRTYHSNVQRMLLAWCESPDLKCVDFASTTLLYSNFSSIVTDQDKFLAAPHGLYEYFKLETETFLHFLARTIRSDVNFTSWRLPLVVGGEYDRNRHTAQFIYWFAEQYCAGHSWRFENEDEKLYGSSWVHLSDLIKHWTDASKSTPGHVVKNVASGFFSLHQLHEYFSLKLEKIGSQPFKLFRSRCEVADDVGLPQRNIEDVLDDVCQIKTQII